MTSAIFPLNQPAWSLFYEMCANIAHALFFRRKSWIYFGATVLTSGIALAVSSEFLHTMDVGPDRGDTLFAFFRVFFSYFLGNLLFRVWKKRWLHVTLPSVLSAAILLAVLAIRVPGPLVPTYDLIVTMAVFPLLLLASASGNPPRGWSKLFQILGTASYAIYVLHMPMEQFFEFTWSRFAHHAPYLDAPWPGMLFVSLVIVFALVADSAFDLPLRAYLRNRLLEPSRANEIQTGRSKHGVSM